MDSKKILILVLVVVAILLLMIIGAGYRPNRGDRSNYQQKEKDGPFSGLDGIFARFRDPFDTTRINRPTTTCQWNQPSMTIAIPGSCKVEINPGKSGSSAFTLTPQAGTIQACYGFEASHLEDCMNDEDKRSTMKPNSRFVVSKGAAILQLYCVPPLPPGGQCAVKVSLEE